MSAKAAQFFFHVSVSPEEAAGEAAGGLVATLPRENYAGLVRVLRALSCALLAAATRRARDQCRAAVLQPGSVGWCDGGGDDGNGGGSGGGGLRALSSAHSSWLCGYQDGSSVLAHSLDTLRNPLGHHAGTGPIHAGSCVC